MKKQYTIEAISTGINPKSINIEMYDDSFKNDVQSDPNYAKLIKVFSSMGGVKSGNGILTLELTAEQNQSLKPYVGMVVEMELKPKEGFGI